MTANITSHDAKRAVRNVSALAAASILSKGALFIWQIVLGNWFGPTDYGIYNTVLGMMAVGASLANLSMGLIAIREVARHPDTINRYWSAMLTTQTVLSLLAYGAILLGGMASGYSDTIIAFSAIASLSLFVDMAGNINHDLLIAQERMVSTSLVEIGHIALRIALAALALALGFGLFGVYGAAILSGMVRSAVLWHLNWRNGHRPHWPVDWSLAQPLLINSLPLALAAFLSLAYQHADKLMTTAIIGETNTGYIGPAFVINFGMIELLSTTILVAVYPLMSRYQEADDNAMFGFMVEKLARFMLIVSLPLTLMLAIFAHDIILFIFSPDYAPTAGILRILIWYTLLTMVGNVFAKALLIQNKQRSLLAIRVAGLSVNLALNTVLLVQYRDPRGAALASVIAELIILVLMVRLFRAEGWDSQRVWPGVLRVLVVGVVSGGVMLLLQGVGLHFMPAMIAGGLFYLVALLLAGAIQADDWDLLYRLLAAMPGGSLIRRYWQRDVVINW